MKARLVAAKDYWIDHLWLDILLSCFVVGVHVMLTISASGYDFMSYASRDERRALYSSTAVVVSLLGAFSGVAIAQASSGKGERVTTLKKHGAKSLANNWRSIYLSAIFAAAMALTCLAVDLEGGGIAAWLPIFARWIFEYSLVLCGVKFLRLISIFHPIIESAALDDAEKSDEKAPAVELHAKWGKLPKTG
ncbi:hypothetical protein [Paenarthrobacter sp. NPDC091669]|uniref:hypothetical protein n=1 Tax=Paenarthrobacter sp. NPDC091669 TaxID=3364384 RepID=UPI003806B863